MLLLLLIKVYCFLRRVNSAILSPHAHDTHDEQMKIGVVQKPLASLSFSTYLSFMSKAKLQIDSAPESKSPSRKFAQASVSVSLSSTPDVLVSIECAPGLSASCEPSRRQPSAQLAAVAVALSASIVNAQSTPKHTGRKVSESTFSHYARRRRSRHYDFNADSNCWPVDVPSIITRERRKSFLTIDF